MSYSPIHDYLLDVARGKITGQTLIRRVGLNPDVDTGAEEDVRYSGGTFPWQTSAQSLEAVSTSTNDVNTTGSGARTIKVWGLDSSYAEVNQTVNMNGTTAVALGTNLVYVDRVEILTTGSGETNAGDVTVQIASGGTVLARVPASFGQSFHCSYFVPVGKTGYLLGWSTSLYQAVSGSVEFRLMIAEDGVGWRVVDLHQLTLNGSGQFSKNQSELLLALPAKTRIGVRTKTSADNMGVSSELMLITM